MLLAAIDIGTNAIRLFFSNVYEKDGIVIAEKASLMRMPVRLGEDVFQTGRISEEKQHELVKTMKAFSLLIDVYKPVAYKAIATAAMREAENNLEVINNIKKETGISIEMVDGLHEALYLSSFSDIKFRGDHNLSMFIDVGGGSTEISLLKNNKLVDSGSFKIGTVRLLNKKVKDKEWTRLNDWLSKSKKDYGRILCIGSGGNINKLTKLYGQIPENILTKENLKKGLKDLKKYSMKERIHILGLRPDRADVIVPAGKIFKYILKHTKSDFIYVPKIGLSDGVVSVLYKEFKEKEKL